MFLSQNEEKMLSRVIPYEAFQYQNTEHVTEQDEELICLQRCVQVILKP